MKITIYKQKQKVEKYKQRKNNNEFLNGKQYKTFFALFTKTNRSRKKRKSSVNK